MKRLQRRPVKAAETAPAEPIELKEKPRRKPLPDHLERIEQVLSVGEDCPECGGDLSKPGEDITEELEYIPGRFVVNKNHPTAYGLPSLWGDIASPDALAPD